MLQRIRAWITRERSMNKLALLTVCLVFTACGEAQPAGQDAAAGDTMQGTIPELRPADSSTALAIDATLTEWAVGLSRDSVPAGVVTINIRNSGTTAHALHIVGTGQDMATEAIAPGADVSMSLDLAAGEYRLVCPLDSAGVKHETKGMATRLRVY